MQASKALLARLVNKRFVIETPFAQLQHDPRDLAAATARLDKLKAIGQASAARAAHLQAEFAPLWPRYERYTTIRAREQVSDPELEQFRWLLEELRVHLYAQELRTTVSVSIRRREKMWTTIEQGTPSAGGRPCMK